MQSVGNKFYGSPPVDRPFGLAHKECQSHGLKLATIKSQEDYENLFIAMSN